MFDKECIPSPLAVLLKAVLIKSYFLNIHFTSFWSHCHSIFLWPLYSQDDSGRCGPGTLDFTDRLTDSICYPNQPWDKHWVVIKGHYILPCQQLLKHPTKNFTEQYQQNSRNILMIFPVVWNASSTVPSSWSDAARRKTLNMFFQPERMLCAWELTIWAMQRTTMSRIVGDLIWISNHVKQHWRLVKIKQRFFQQ